MIRMPELLKDKLFDQQDSKVKDNLLVLLERLNIVRTLWAKPMTITSGLRTREDQIRIYKELAEKRGVPFRFEKIPWGSQHLIGAAGDVSDPDGSLFAWCKAHEAELLNIGLWIEEKDDQHRVHFQIFQYASWVPGKTIFFVA